MPLNASEAHSALLQRGLELVHSLILACSPPSKQAQAANASEFWFNMRHVHQLAACLRDLSLGPWEVDLLQEASQAEAARVAAHSSSIRKGVPEWNQTEHNHLMTAENAHRSLLRESLVRAKGKIEAISRSAAPEVLARLDPNSDAAITGFEGPQSPHVIRLVSVATIMRLREREGLDQKPDAPKHGRLGVQQTVQSRELLSSNPDQFAFGVPKLENSDSRWITHVALSNDAKFGIKVASLKNARRRGKRSDDFSVGIDDRGRMWRRDPKNAQLFWYFLPSIPSKKSLKANEKCPSQ